MTNWLDFNEHCKKIRTYLLIFYDFLKYKEANIEINSRRFGVIETSFSRQNESIMPRFDLSSLFKLAYYQRITSSSSEWSLFAPLGMVLKHGALIRQSNLVEYLIIT